MSHSFSEKCQSILSPIHGLSSPIKIVGALAYILCLVTTPSQNLLAFVIYAGLWLWLMGFAKLPLRKTAFYAAAVLPFSFFMVIGVLFLGGGEKISFFGVSLSQQGIWIVAGVLMKSFLGACMTLLLVSTTRAHDLWNGMRRLHVPPLFVDLLAMTYRYLFLLMEEKTRLYRAALARGYRATWLGEASIIGRLIGNLFLRSFERAERLYGAMRLRGYQGFMPIVLSEPIPVQERLDVGLFILTLLLTRWVAV